MMILALLGAGIWWFYGRGATAASTFYRGRNARMGSMISTKGGVVPAANNSSPSMPASATNFYNPRREGFYRATSLHALGM